MPTTKTGQMSHVVFNQEQMDHFDADNKIQEQLATIDISIKRRLATRLPALIDELKKEQTPSENAPLA
jgi:hypothetical protein